MTHHQESACRDSRAVVACDCPQVRLTHPKGDAVEIYMQGANITSWKRRNGRELLHLRSYNPFDNSDSIQ